jgi:crotonobetainyl-CoA:carnitine CoA-transferase CaiB-like acyl-CoA transferase
MTTSAPLNLLRGVRVLSFTQFLLGPAGVQYLADMGADVIKIEAPGGRLYERTWSGCDLFLNGVSAFYLCANRNQRNLTLDLKQPEGQAIAKRLVAEADVLVQNFRPGVAARLGLDYKDLTDLNPRLIYVSASGYGETSPYRDRPGQDLLIQGISGLASISGRGDAPPTPAGSPIVDQHGAALLAMGVAAALFDRTRTERGQKIEITMLRAALDLQMEVLTYYLNGGQMRRSPTGLASMVHPGPYGVYRTKDSYLVLSSSPLSTLQAALQVPELDPIAKEPYTFRHRERIAQIVEPVIQTRTTAEWLEYLVPRGVWAAPVLTYDELFAHPVAQGADVTEEVEHPVAGHVRLLRFPLEFSSGRARVRRLPPASGEHTDEILHELGYTPEERTRLRRAKVI